MNASHATIHNLCHTMCVGNVRFAYHLRTFFLEDATHYIHCMAVKGICLSFSDIPFIAIKFTSRIAS